MLRLQPSEITLTQAEVQQWTKTFAARRVASNAAKEFLRTHGHHASARVRQGPERSRDDALVVLPEGYLPSPHAGSTESSVDLSDIDYALTDTDAAGVDISLYDEAENTSQSHAFSEEGSMSEDLEGALGAMKIDDAFGCHVRSSTRRFRPRSWSDPASSSEIPQLYLPPHRYRQSVSPVPIGHPANRSSTINADGRSPWIDGGIDTLSNMPMTLDRRRVPALGQFALARGGRPRIPISPRVPRRTARTPLRGSNEENQDNDFTSATLERQISRTIRRLNDHVIMESTPPERGRLETRLRREQYGP